MFTPFIWLFTLYSLTLHSLTHYFLNSQQIIFIMFSTRSQYGTRAGSVQSSSYKGIEKLNSANYSEWQNYAQAKLVKEKLWSIVENFPENPTNAQQANNNLAKAELILMISPCLVHQVGTLGTAKEIWDTLKANHNASALANQFSIYREIHSLSVRKNDMVTYLDKMVQLRSRYLSCGGQMSESDLAMTILIHLPEEYSTTSSILTGGDQDEFKLSNVIAKLKAESSRIHTSTERAHWTTSKRPKFNSNETKKKTRCNTCKKYHIGTCRYLKDKPDKPEIVQQTIEQLNKTTINQENWYIDSCATSHCSNNRDQFVSLKRIMPRQIKTAKKNESFLVKFIGSIKLQIQTTNNQIIETVIENVYYNENFSSNLLSQAKLSMENGFEFHYVGDSVEILHQPSNSKLPIVKQSQFTFLMPTIDAEIAHSVKDAVLWHRRLGHASSAALENVIGKIPKSHLPFCQTCALSKQVRQTYKSNDHRTQSIKVKWHSDIAGPFPEDREGNKWFATFIDDYSRYVFVYLLPQKSDWFKAFERFLKDANIPKNTLREQDYPLIANRRQMFDSTFHKIILRVDNAKEMLSSKVKALCAEYNIEPHPNTPYCKEEHGLAERYMRTLNDIARASRKDADLDEEFWGDAIQCAVYVHNRIPKSILSFKSPFELWNGFPPSYSHLRVFGCKAFAQVPKELRSKLDDHAEETIFLGYLPNIHSYRLMRPNGTIIHRRDVKFDETSQSNYSFPPDSIDGDIDAASENDPPSATSEQSPDPNDSFYIDVPSMTDWASGGEIVNKINSSNVLPGSHVSVSDPVTYKEALSGPEASSWQAALKDEYQSLIENGTWTLVPRPRQRKIIKCKWVFKRKRDVNRSIERYKARLCAKGFTQIKGFDYTETFAPVAKLPTVRLFLAFAAMNAYLVHHMDVKTAFLYARLLEEIFMEQPEGFVDPQKPDHVLKLLKCIYGLKQSPRNWNAKLHQTLLELGLTRSESDWSVYYKHLKDNSLIIVIVFVDDIIIMSKHETEIKQVKEHLMSQYKMSDLGEIKKYLGMHIHYEKEKQQIHLDQSHYIKDLLERFKMETSKEISTPLNTDHQLTVQDDKEEDCPHTTPYREAIGALLYLSLCTRPDIAYSVNLLSQYVSKPKLKHWQGVKRILRYLKGTINHKLILGGEASMNIRCHTNEPANILQGFADADWAGNKTDRKSTSGYVFQLGTSTISWSSTKQAVVAMSTTEAEYVSLSNAAKEALWLRQLLLELKIKPDGIITIYSDNIGAVELSKSTKFHKRSKHIDIKHHFLKELTQESKIIQVQHIPTDEMKADILTKALPKYIHDKQLKYLGCLSFETREGVEVGGSNSDR